MNKHEREQAFSGEDFYGRIKMIMETEGYTTDSEFEKAIGMRGRLYSWRKGLDRPKFETLIKIKNIFKVSIDWLLTGEGEPFFRAAESLHNYKSQVSAEIDTEKISQIVKDMEEYLTELSLKIGASRKGQLVTMLYEYWITEKRKPDKDIIKAYLPLTHK